MNIGGILVRAWPEQIGQVREALAQIEGVEVHGANEDGRMVVTVEKATTGELSDMLVLMQDVPGVLSAAMVYHQIEESGSEEAE